MIPFKEKEIRISAFSGIDKYKVELLDEITTNKIFIPTYKQIVINTVPALMEVIAKYLRIKLQTEKTNLKPNPMKQAIFIPEISHAPKENPIVLTHRKKNGWVEIGSGKSEHYLSQAHKVVYLGKCGQDGDMFSLYVGEYIMIFKGRLNSGKY